MSMLSFTVPYGRDVQYGEADTANLSGIYESGVSRYEPQFSEEILIRNALDNPVESERLESIAANAKKAVIIASDHTRPVPSRLIFPQMLERLRMKNPGIDVTILIATGCHRGTTKAELTAKFGEAIVKNEKIIIHDCRDETSLASLGTLPSGGELKINRLAVECDLLLSEGFIEPHFFAGFSGGRKSVLPGIAGEKTVMGNHCAKFISSQHTRAGMLEKNPIHKDMIYAAEKAKLKFIVNVVLNSEKKVIHAVAGNPLKAHSEGCRFIGGLCRIKVPESQIVVTGNGGYPLDQNIYQSVKGMSAAEAVCAEGGVIIMVSECSDGHGGEYFYRQLSEAASPQKLLSEIKKVPQDMTVPDQWEAQILARILSRFTVIMVCSEQSSAIVKAMHMQYAPTLKEALETAFMIKGRHAKISVIPDGVSVIAEKV